MNDWNDLCRENEKTESDALEKGKQKIIHLLEELEETARKNREAYEQALVDFRERHAEWMRQIREASDEGFNRR